MSRAGDPLPPRGESKQTHLPHVQGHRLCQIGVPRSQPQRVGDGKTASHPDLPSTFVSRSCRSALQQPQHGGTSQSGSIGKIQLALDVLAVSLDRLVAEEQFLGNLLGA